MPLLVLIIFVFRACQVPSTILATLIKSFIENILNLFYHQVWPGQEASTLRYEHGAMLCVNSVNKVFGNQTVLELMLSQQQAMRNRGTLGQFYDEMKKQLVGKIILTLYR